MLRVVQFACRLWPYSVRVHLGSLWFCNILYPRLFGVVVGCSYELKPAINIVVLEHMPARSCQGITVPCHQPKDLKDKHLWLHAEV
jgi:hypothetical protein